MTRRADRRAAAARIAELEAANALLRAHLRVSLAISEHYLRQKIAADMADRAAQGPIPDFEHAVRSLHVYGSSIRKPPNILGGIGV